MESFGVVVLLVTYKLQNTSLASFNFVGLRVLSLLWFVLTQTNHPTDPRPDIRIRIPDFSLVVDLTLDGLSDPLTSD